MVIKRNIEVINQHKGRKKVDFQLKKKKMGDEKKIHRSWNEEWLRFIFSYFLYCCSSSTISISMKRYLHYFCRSLAGLVGKDLLYIQNIFFLLSIVVGAVHLSKEKLYEIAYVGISGLQKKIKREKINVEIETFKRNLYSPFRTNKVDE